MTRLVDIAGRKQALYILASGGRMDAQQAAALQLADAIVEPTVEVPLLHHALAFLRPLVHAEPAGVPASGGGAGGPDSDEAPLPVDDLVLATVKATVAAAADAMAGGPAAAGSRDALGYAMEGAAFRQLWGGAAQRGFMSKFEGGGMGKGKGR